MSKIRSSKEIRTLFLQYFEENGHKIVPSSSLVPTLDPTLLFTNAGMNQFKDVFTGQEKRSYSRAASTQKCVRAGGKHNDLENVGRTARHHTFFEMLGNFSFGDYFKKEAIAYSWEFVTKTLNLSTDRLYITIFRDDDDAFDIWKNDIGIDEKRIYRFDEKDNFWSMGDIGPCGPCSEIFYDQGSSLSCGKSDCDVGCECDRYIEFWNLVFMEFEQKADGSRTRLPKPSIDTGMGLERLSAIVQGAKSNYDSDLFRPLLDEIAEAAGQTYDEATVEDAVSMRVMADHLRAMTFLVGDGVRPSNEGRGYVLRRIMRRAMRHARQIGFTKPILFKLSNVLVKQMGDAFPEIKKNAKSTAATIQDEEKRFAKTIDRGMSLLDDEMKKMRASGSTVLPGSVAFNLYDTYGFPADLTADVLREQNYTLDQAGFDEAFEVHREKARGSWKGSGNKALEALVGKWTAEGLKSEFLGYTALTGEGTIERIVKGGKEVKKAKEGDEIEIVADRTPFYGESGGQVGDIGAISGEGFSLEVIDTQKPVPDLFIHRCLVTEGSLSIGQKAHFSVDAKARSATAKNHTATHILHATLHEVLGKQAKQEGSWVGPERLRFDFSHSQALTPAEIAQIEETVNERIWTDCRVQKEVLPIEEAMNSGAMALFDEKYGENVRVISVGDFSKELCGGTHLDRTGEIGLFKIIKESSVSAGVRRIEGFTGYRALHYAQDIDRKMREVGYMLGVSPEELGPRVEKMVQRQKELEKENRKLRTSGGSLSSSSVSTHDVGGVKVVTNEAEGADQRELRDIADRQLEKVKSGIVAIGAKKNGKAFVVVKVSKDLTKQFKAGDLIKPAAEVLGGSGGGRPDMAQAGGPNSGELAKALEAVVNTVTHNLFAHRVKA